MSARATALWSMVHGRQVLVLGFSLYFTRPSSLRHIGETLVFTKRKAPLFILLLSSIPPSSLPPYLSKGSTQRHGQLGRKGEMGLRSEVVGTWPLTDKAVNTPGGTGYRSRLRCAATEPRMGTNVSLLWVYSHHISSTDFFLVSYHEPSPLSQKGLNDGKEVA